MNYTRKLAGEVLSESEDKEFGRCIYVCRKNNQISDLMDTFNKKSRIFS